MFIMSASLSSAPQRCAVCFCKGCEWVCVGAGAVGGGAEPNMFFIKDERRESFYWHLCQVWGRVCVFTERRNWPLTPALIRSYLQAHPHRVPGVHVWSGCDSVPHWAYIHWGGHFLRSSSFSYKLIYTIAPLHLVSTCSFLPLTFVEAKEAQDSVSKGQLSGNPYSLLCG